MLTSKKGMKKKEKEILKMLTDLFSSSLSQPQQHILHHIGLYSKP